jgi:hypothetical protein
MIARLQEELGPAKVYFFYLKERMTTFFYAKYVQRTTGAGVKAWRRMGFLALKAEKAFVESCIERDSGLTL